LPFYPNLEGIAQEKYFYKLRHLSAEDLAFVQKFVIDQSPEVLREKHEHWINIFTAVQKRKDYAKRHGISNPELDAMIDELECNLEENLHGLTERISIPLLDQMRENDLKFYTNDEDCIIFYHYLSTQYFRTNPMKKRMCYAYKSLGLDNYNATWNITAHIHAANLGATLYRNRKRYEPLILNNDSSSNLITGDQPIINVHNTAGGMKPTEPTGLEFYYPLGPDRALFLRDLLNSSGDVKQRLQSKDVKYYNKRIALNCFSQIYAKSKNDLREYSAYGPSSAEKSP